jgi:hypothetical protein
MSAIGPKRTSLVAPHMSAFGVRADIARSYDSDIHDRHLVDLVSLLVHDDDEPTSPIPARHDRAMFEVACKRHRIVASGGIARQVNAFVIVKNFVAVSDRCIPIVGRR